MPIGAAAIIGGGSLLSGLLGSNAATSAADTQAAAARQASQTQLAEFNQIQKSLAPFLSTGIQAGNELYALLGGGSSSPFTSALGVSPITTGQVGQPPTLGALPTMATPGLGTLPNYKMPAFTAKMFENTPGYKFQVQQAENAAQNSGAARGGAFSGNTMNALQTNAQGLASQDYWNAYNAFANNYNNQYNAQLNNVLNRYNAAFQGAQANYNSGVQNQVLPFNAANSNYWNLYNADVGQQNTIANILNTLAGRGAATASTQGNLGQLTAAQVGANQIGAGNALAAGQVGSTGALSNSINSVLTQLAAPQQSGTNASLLNQLLAGGSTGQNFDAFGGPGYIVSSAYGSGAGGA